MRRHFLSVLLLLPALGCLATPAVLASADVSLDDVLKDARKALGGEQALAKVTGFSAEGTYRRTIGQREMSGDLEIAMALPDRYLRVETFSFTGDPGNRMIMSRGFNQDTSLDNFGGGAGGGMVMRFGGPGGPGGSGGGAGQPGGRIADPQVAARMLRASKVDASRLALAFLMRGDAVLPLELSYGGEAESPDGKADIVEVKGEGNIAFRLFLDKESHLPLMMSWREPAPRVMNMQRQPGAPQPSAEERERMMREARERAEKEPPKMVDAELFFSDFKKVDGVMLPHTFRRSSDGTVTEEWSIAKYKVNPTFKPDTFTKR